MMWCLSASYFSWLTPMTMVMSSLEAGAEMMTFLAPACRCFSASDALVKKPVDSMTTSTPRSPQPRWAGSFCGKHLDALVADDDEGTVNGDLFVQAAEDGVVLDEHGQIVDRTEVVDCDNFDVCAIGEAGSQEVASDASETINANTGSHVNVS